MVRKKLGWKHEPFQIPNNLLSEWKKIGEEAGKSAQKQEKKFKKVINGKNISSLNKSIEEIKNKYLENIKPLATKNLLKCF